MLSVLEVLPVFTTGGQPGHISAGEPLIMQPLILLHFSSAAHTSAEGGITTHVEFLILISSGCISYMPFVLIWILSSSVNLNNLPIPF